MTQRIFVTDIEVCLDNLESLPLAIAGGATRIELCSALALGGLTPSYGIMYQAAQQANVPIYAMIRPRQGDFLYAKDDIASMLHDIDAAAKAGLQGVVFGALTQEGDINLPAMRQLIQHAHQQQLGVTFHRAFDHCRHVSQALEHLIDLGCERVLTSGTKPTALAGVDILRQLVKQADNRIAIMAGAGINAHNVRDIVTASGVQQVHLSGKSQRPSQMQQVASQAQMGAQQHDDFLIPITNQHAIEEVVKALAP